MNKLLHRLASWVPRRRASRETPAIPQGACRYGRFSWTVHRESGVQVVSVNMDGKFLFRLSDTGRYNRASVVAYLKAYAKRRKLTLWEDDPCK